MTTRTRRQARRQAGADPRAARQRWALLSPLDIGADGDPYLDRLELVKTPLGGLYLHHIHREDREADPHDHPWGVWGFFSLVLCGGYEETILRDKRDYRTAFVRTRGRWSLRGLSPRSAHIITSVTGPLWTLVLTGPHRGDWGFWRNGTFISHRDYNYAEPARSGQHRQHKAVS